jgi:hypothetical protein
MRYDPKTENIEYLHTPGGGVISDDSLKGLDKELAAYPFEGLGLCRSLLTQVTPGVVEKVMKERKEGRLDGMTGVQGIEEEDARLNSSINQDGKVEVGVEGERRLAFPVVDPKRSWRDGAIGEEITKYSKDKSWLLGDLAKQEGNGKSRGPPSYTSLRSYGLMSRSSPNTRLPPTRIHLTTPPILLLQSTNLPTSPHPLYPLSRPLVLSINIHPIRINDK